MLCKYIRNFEKFIFKRLDTIYRIKVNSNLGKNFKFGEVTITETFLIEMFELRNVNIQIYEAKNEKVNGNDIELFIVKNQKIYFFPIQAKKTDINSKFSSFKFSQLLSLQQYALTNKGNPLYFFYNYFGNSNIKLSNKKEYGVTYSLLTDIFNLVSRKSKGTSILYLKDLFNENKITWPIHTLFCDSSCFDEFIIFEEEIELKNWKKIDNIESNDIKYNNHNKFSPKYRIILKHKNND